MLITTMSSRARRASLLVVTAGAIAFFSSGASTQAPRFYSDDPIAREPESQDASKAEPYDQSQMFELVHNLFVTSKHKPSGLRAKNINTIDEVPDSSWFTNRIGTRTVTSRRAYPRRERRRAARSVEVGADPGEDIRRAPGFHCAGRQGRHLVPRVRSTGVCRRRNRRGGDCDEDFLGAGLQPGRVVPDHVRSEERDHRPEGDGASAVRDADAVHEGRHQRDPRESRARTRTARIASSPADCSPARSWAASGMPARARTTPTTSSLTSIVASCVRSGSSVRGPTSPTSRRRTRSTPSSPRTASRSSSTTSRTSARRSACATTSTSGT